MSLDGKEIEVEIRQVKTSSKYKVSILRHGEEISCADLDCNGNSLNSKIVKLLAELIGKSESETKLTKEGEMEVRHSKITNDPIAEEDLENEEPFQINKDKDKDFDMGYGF